MYSPRYWLFEKCRFWNVPANGKIKTKEETEAVKAREQMKLRSKQLMNLAKKLKMKQNKHNNYE